MDPNSSVDCELLYIAKHVKILNIILMNDNFNNNKSFKYEFSTRVFCEVLRFLASKRDSKGQQIRLICFIHWRSLLFDHDYGDWKFWILRNAQSLL